MRLFLCFSNIVSIIKSRVLCEFQSETLSVTHPSFKSLDEGRRAQEEGDKTLELMPELPCNDAFFERRSWESGVCSFMFFSLRGLRKKAIKSQCLNIILNILTFQLIWISAPKLYRCNFANFSAWKKFKNYEFEKKKSNNNFDLRMNTITISFSIIIYKNMTRT